MVCLSLLLPIILDFKLVMKRYRAAKYIFGFLLILAVSCIEDYLPPEIEAPTGYLVIDGYINSGEGESRVLLFRTQNLADTSKPAIEVDAQVYVENEKNQRKYLMQKEGGVYTLPNTELNKEQKYRLVINTADGKEYVSEYISVRPTPPIDSLS